jgi:hypothetical protein
MRVEYPKLAVLVVSRKTKLKQSIDQHSKTFTQLSTPNTTQHPRPQHIHTNVAGHPGVVLQVRPVCDKPLTLSSSNTLKQHSRIRKAFNMATRNGPTVEKTDGVNFDVRLAGQSVHLVNEASELQKFRIRAESITNPATQIWLVRQKNLAGFFNKRGIILFIPFGPRDSREWACVALNDIVPSNSLIPESDWPSPGMTIRLDSETRVKTNGVETIEKLKAVIAQRLDDMRVFGGWDIMSPITPLVERARRWGFWMSEAPSPQFVATRTDDPAELTMNGRSILLALNNVKVNEPLKDDLFVLVSWIVSKLPSLSKMGRQRASGLFNRICMTWQYRQSLAGQASILMQYGWPLNHKGNPLERLAIFVAGANARTASNSFAAKHLWKKGFSLSNMRRKLRQGAAKSMSPKDYKALLRPDLELKEGSKIDDDAESQSGESIGEGPEEETPHDPPQTPSSQKDRPKKMKPSSQKKQVFDSENPETLKVAPTSEDEGEWDDIPFQEPGPSVQDRTKKFYKEAKDRAKSTLGSWMSRKWFWKKIKGVWNRWFAAPKGIWTPEPELGFKGFVETLGAMIIYPFAQTFNNFNNVWHRLRNPKGKKRMSTTERIVEGAWRFAKREAHIIMTIPSVIFSCVADLCRNLWAMLP